MKWEGGPLCGRDVPEPGGEGSPPDLDKVEAGGTRWVAHFLAEREEPGHRQRGPTGPPGWVERAPQMERRARSRHEREGSPALGSCLWHPVPCPSLDTTPQPPRPVCGSHLRKKGLPQTAHRADSLGDPCFVSHAESC